MPAQHCAMRRRLRPQERKSTTSLGGATHCAAPEHQDEHVLRWVVSTSDDFDDAAKALAEKEDVSLFNKTDFIDLLVRVFPTDCRDIPEMF